MKIRITSRNITAD